MDTGVLIAILSVVEALGVAVIGAIVAYANKKYELRSEKDDEREAKRVRRDTCLYDLVFAEASATEVLLLNAKGDQINGNVESALKDIEEAKAKCNHVFNEHVAAI